MPVQLYRPSDIDGIRQALADADEATVIGGGTVVVPEHALGRLQLGSVIDLGLAQLNQVEVGSVVTIGAMASLGSIAELAAPIGPCVRNIADVEVRAQATVGGNICSPPPLGDLRGPLLALGAQVEIATSAGIETVPVTGVGARTASAGSAGSVVLKVSFEPPAAGAFVALGRPHTVSLTPASVSAARSRSGAISLAATGMGPDAVRLTSVEELVNAGERPEVAAAAANDDADPYDDELASAGYRARVLPALVARALEQLEET